MVSLSIFHQPEITGQPPGTSLWWGYGLHPERDGDFVAKPMNQCTGAEILEETLRHLRFDKQLAAIMASSIFIPCDLPYVNNIWLPRSVGDRPPAVPKGSTNLGLIGQYVEIPKDIAFTIEYSVRAAWDSDLLPAQARPRAAARLSGPVRSEGAVRRAESVCLSVIRAADRSRRCRPRLHQPFVENLVRYSCRPPLPLAAHRVISARCGIWSLSGHQTSITFDVEYAP